MKPNDILVALNAITAAMALVNQLVAASEAIKDSFARLQAGAATGSEMDAALAKLDAEIERGRFLRKGLE